MDNIKQLQEKLKTILCNDESGFAEKIDQFNPEYAMNNLSNYWNSSVKDFYNALKNIIPTDWDDTDKEGHDAGYSFSNNPYVNPNVNKNKENYYDVRGNDKIVSVLKNKQHLDYTIGNDEIKQIAADIKEYMTRLLMPQYKRRVEIEDLNRDFWVIGQNLTALNEVILKIGNEFLNLLIAELCGLWDNIYRLWQVLFYIEDSIEEMASGEKIRIMMEYGYGDLEDTTNKSSVVFTKKNAYKYGILPYISKKKINSAYVAFVQYNKRLWNLPQNNADLLKEFTGNSSLIKLEKKTNRKLLEVFNYIKSKNFVLLAKGDKDCFSSIASAEDPIATVLDFYRDFIVLANNADKQKALNIIIKDTSVWKQAGYLKNIDFNTKNSATEITENVRNSFRIVKGLITNKHFNTSIFFDKVINCQSTAITQLISDISNPFDDLIKDFYNLFSDCQDLINFKGYSKDPDFNDPNSTSETPRKYTVPSEESINDFNKQLDEYTKANALEKDKIFRMWTGGKLPIVVWDLLSMSDSIQTNQSMSGFGGDYFFPYKGSSDHLWIDFVANIRTDSYNLTNANKEAGIGEKSTIGSITMNDLMNDDKSQEKDTVYDVNISVPINKRKATEDDKTKKLLPAYHDFVRINKPYPKITAIEANMRTVEDSIDSEKKIKNWNDLRHLHDLNDEDNWITYKDGKTYYCVDGFYAFNNNFTYSNITNSDEMKNIITTSNSKTMKNLLTYQISTSDMISCEHEEKGQSKVKNLYDFSDPVVNLRFINGKFNGQEIEIVLTKDRVKTPTPITTTTITTYSDKTINLKVVFWPISGPKDDNKLIYDDTIYTDNPEKGRYSLKKEIASYGHFETGDNKIIIPVQVYEQGNGAYVDVGWLIYGAYLYLGAESKLAENVKYQPIHIALRFWDANNNAGGNGKYTIPTGWKGTSSLYDETHLAADGKCYLAGYDMGSTATAKYKITTTVTNKNTTTSYEMQTPVSLHIEIGSGYYTKNRYKKTFGDKPDEPTGGLKIQSGDVHLPFEGDYKIDF